jgi:hypothetical protein
VPRPGEERDLPRAGSTVQVEFKGALYMAHVRPVTSAMVHAVYGGDQPSFESIPLSDARERVVSAAL